MIPRYHGEDSLSRRIALVARMHSAVLFSFLFTISFQSQAADSPFKVATEIRTMISENKFSEADAALTKALAGKNSSDVEEALLYLQAMNDAAAGSPEKTLNKVDELLKKKPLLEEESRALRAQALEKMGRWEESLAENKRLLEMAPNFQLKFDANLRIGRARLAGGKIADARNIFVALEKKARGTPGHQEVIIELARAERRMHHSGMACKWFAKLYRQYPTQNLIKEWGPDLSTNELDGRRTACQNSRGDFRDRIRSLMWSGEEEKARGEVQQVASVIAKENRLAADEMRAWFLLQNGEPDEAYKIIEPGLAQRSSDPDFLTVFASAAARSGNGNAAVGAYHRLWELSPRSEKGRRALYQSAFMSYQFQDYDGAARRFREFLVKFPKTKLAEDARWNIAWISYLRKDFEGARAKFAQLANSKKAGGVRERARYWMAMSLLRLDRPQEARPFFESIAKEKSGSYYGTIARQRLADLPKLSAKAKSANEISESSRLSGPFRSAEVLSANWEGGSSADSLTIEEPDSESALAAAPELETSVDPAAESNINESVADSGKSDVLEDTLALKAPGTGRRFDRARLLSRMGLTDQARWELFEIERKTHSKDDLKTLITAYEDLGQWHRSSTIAQLRFGSVRVAQGMDGARGLWESAYPRAFAGDVKDGARREGIPEEFIWGIMKAESQYRRDAVSPVGALGLMQIMPGTGLKIAALRGEKGFRPTQLLEAPTAISLGSYYLKRLSKQFGDSIPLAAAAYNAGPHRVHSWLLAFGALDMDEFVEHIPFLETREYVRKVVANALTYANLYKGKQNLIDLATPVKAHGRAELAKRESWDAP